MLGGIIRKNRWSFCAFGKHPCSGDFFSLSIKSVLANAFVRWAETGYETVLERGKKPITHHIYRFWAGGIEKGSVLCGLMRDSGDALGRKYPLVMMGEGELKNWETRWELLPFCFETLWGRMESLSVRRTETIQQFETGIKSLKAPVEIWKSIQSKSKKTGHATDHHLRNGISASRVNGIVGGYIEDKTAHIHIDHSDESHAFSTINFWHRMMKNNTNGLPSVVFMGGTPERSSITFFSRPLKTKDFAILWLA